jgi:DNA-binding NarL/FixJ family response regulator
MFPTMQSNEIKLLVVDDHPVFRRGLREIIAENPNFSVVGEASDGEAAMRMIVDLKPDIAVVDIDMPRLNGLELVRALRKIDIPVATVFLTMYKEEDMYNAAMDMGVKAYVLKEMRLMTSWPRWKKSRTGKPLSAHPCPSWASGAAIACRNCF